MERNKARLWWLSVILTLLSTTVGNIIGFGFWLMAFIAIYPTMSLASDSSDLMTVISLLSTLGAILCVFIFTWIIYHQKLSTLGFSRHKFIRYYLSGLLLGVILFVIPMSAAMIFGSLKLNFGDIQYSLIAGYFIGFMVQGMSEEVVCRGFLQYHISKRFGIWAGMLFNSILFGCLHLLNNYVTVLSIVNIMLFGLFMSLLYWYTNNMWLLGALHGAWNFIQGPIFGIEVSGNSLKYTVFDAVITSKNTLLSGGDFGIEGSIFTTVTLIIAMIVVYYLIRKRGEDKC